MQFSIASIFVLLLATFAAADKYIVVLNKNDDGLLGQVISSVLPKGLARLLKFGLGPFSGFGAELTQDQVAKLQKNPNVGQNCACEKRKRLIKVAGSLCRKGWATTDMGCYEQGSSAGQARD
jgi:hypothetical protein